MKKYRDDFLMLNQDYIYVNSSATSLKPKVVIDCMVEYYTKYGVNTNRGVDSLGFLVTEKYEMTRQKVADFIGCHKQEIVFTRGTTDSLNLLVNSFGNMIINKDDEIVVSVIEHHSNFVPWQQLAKRKGAKLVFVPLTKDGLVTKENLLKVINKKTKIVALNHVSNVMGGLNDLKELGKIIKQCGAYFIVDGAQGIIHEEIDLKKMDVDFYAFSGHKVFGPMGVGVLYGKEQLLNMMDPITFGGEMVFQVTKQTTTFKESPYKFEAGTMMVPEVLGLASALDYIKEIGLMKMVDYTNNLRNYLLEKLLKEIPNINIYNKNIKNTNLLTFNIEGIHAHDVASYFDRHKIIVRAGHHCASLYMQELNVEATVRISLSFYNTKEECDEIVRVLKGVGDYINVLF